MTNFHCMQMKARFSTNVIVNSVIAPLAMNKSWGHQFSKKKSKRKQENIKVLNLLIFGNPIFCVKSASTLNISKAILQ